MRTSGIFILLLCSIALYLPAHADPIDPFDSVDILGPATATLATYQGRDCNGTLIYNHDDSFENGYIWAYGGYQPPYYGAFGEGFDMGSGQIECVVLWLTQTGGFYGQPIDVYIWDGGVSREPGNVLTVGYEVVIEAPAMWPEISQHNLPLPFFVHDEFTIGFWGPWMYEAAQIYIAVDSNGPNGNPWTNIAPEYGPPNGWQDPSLVFGPTASLGMGLFLIDMPTPVKPDTWGALKSLVR
ncbi:MAG: hypothetical protein KJ970_15680 [Candidatus Eisenbacteria bacterium]|uniref:Uncharacterized protein n=1 Tax=Eiseniibacteriota bacterium TaxID=2212470 RepID=A0A948WE19_UNCEI|nr:hypothetical protein [Candidatus Eisenbacteria bacterium]MBU1948092.1 hypothetical protein [Candidatus Eisenbacteria bacterium]MBU2692363.1 hypothetical protein [Candidatus Eisenbacteria bacterium]